MNAAITVRVIAQDGTVDEHLTGTLVGLRPDVSVDAQLGSDANARELIARMVIDWAAGFGDLEVDVR